MDQDNRNDMTSGFIIGEDEDISSKFTQIEELPSPSHCRLVKAVRFGRRFLLKGLKPEYARQEIYRQMLQKEFTLMMHLQHSGIVQTYGMEKGNTDPSIGMDEFIVMEWIDGETLTEWLKGDHSRSNRRLIVDELLQATQYMHAQQVVHRDLKPDNIMIARNGDKVKIIDFGLADTESYDILKQPAGTQRYMAPEQMNTTVADCRNDIYSLGIIINEINPGSPYKAIVKRCLAPIGERYAKVDNIFDALKRYSTLKHYGRLALSVLALGAVVMASIIAGNRLSQRELERPSGKYVFYIGTDNESCYTNWSNGLTDGVVFQYAGKKSPTNFYVPASVSENSNLWHIGELGFGAFKDCDKLETLTIECSEFSIQKDAFKGCRKLMVINMPNITHAPRIGGGNWVTVIDSIFEPYHFENVTLRVPDVELLSKDESWSRFKHIEKLNASHNTKN